MDISLLIGGSDISACAKKIAWEGNMRSIVRTLRAELAGGYIPKPGERLEFALDGELLFSGMVMSISGEERSTVLMAADMGIYLARNYAHKEYRGTPQAISRQVCAEFSLPIFKIEEKKENTRVVSPGTMTASSVIRTAYDGVYEKRYHYIGFEPQGLHIYRLDNAEACDVSKIIELSRSESIEDMVNRTAILSTNGLREKAFVENAEERALYGTFGRTYRKKRTRNSIVEAKKLLRSAKIGGYIRAKGNALLRTGKRAVCMDFPEGRTIISDEHIFSPDGYTTRIEF